MRSHGRRLGRIVLAGLLAACLEQHAAAHSSSNSYVQISQPASGPALRWDIALRDLELAVGLDQDGDGAITWGELRASETQVLAYALPRLSIADGSGPCRLTTPELLVSDLSDGAYAVIRSPLACGGGERPQRLTIDYRLLFDIDARHRGLVRFGTDSTTSSAVMTPERPQQVLQKTAGSSWREFTAYLQEGIWHIWKGFDHVLFLLCLLLPAVYVATHGKPRRDLVAAPAIGPVLLDVFRIVTAFTLAHSITLTLAALQWVELPPRLVESSIAASVVLAAANNLGLWVINARWALAFAFGLIHGFGFANALRDLGLADGRFVPALLGFNLGVEVGQLAIVGVFVPLAFRLRHTRFYRRIVLTGGSALVICIASLWLIERMFDLSIADLVK